MSRRSNNVRGPTSALTEFLRESGITHDLFRRRARQEQEQPEAGPSNANDEGESEGGEVEGVADSAREAHEANEYDSDKLDDSEDEPPSRKKRKLTKKQEKEQKAKAKAKAKSKSKGKKIEDDSDESEDEYTELSRVMFDKKGKVATVKPPVGSFENCAKCTKQFTITKYTMAANPPPGWLCHVCAKASGADPFKKPALPRKRKAPEQKGKDVYFEDKTFKSLASRCIDVIGKHIDDIEALGDIGAMNMFEIGRVLAKNRSLTPGNAPLLCDIKNTALTIHDSTNLTPDAFCTVASLNPGLRDLRLDLCGRIENTALKHWESHMPFLSRLELLGPFLVRCEAWKGFFASHPQLNGFLITQSPRFDLSCMESLAQHCPDLEELRLSEIGQMSDEFLGFVAGFNKLSSLDLSRPSTSLSTEAVVDLLKVVGHRLTHLNLSGNDSLTDDFLLEGLKTHIQILTSLILDNMPELTDKAVGDFFNTTSNIPIKKISMLRDSELADESLTALLAHSGRSLLELNINSWRNISNEALLTIGDHAPNLRKVDIGWCRNVDDFVMKAVIDGCPHVDDINVFGCNKLTVDCPKKRGVSIRGNEAQRTWHVTPQGEL